jgi:hypothetical protein
MKAWGERNVKWRELCPWPARMLFTNARTERILAGACSASGALIRPSQPIGLALNLCFFVYGDPELTTAL